MLASTTDDANVEQDVVTNRKRALLQRLAELENALSEFLPTDEEVLAIEMAKPNDEVANIVKKYVHKRIVDSGGFKTIDKIGEQIHKLRDIMDEMCNTYGREAMRKMFGFEGKVKKEFYIHGRLDKLMRMVRRWKITVECYADVEQSNAGVDGFVSGGCWDGEYIKNENDVMHYWLCIPCGICCQVFGGENGTIV